MNIRKTLFFTLLSLWPPYLGAGIRVRKVDPEFRTLEVEMKMRFWNKNYVGTHFGGSLYAMCDPFFMLILMQNLGRDYIVWDKAATVRFRKPGRGTVRAKFHIPPEKIEEIRRLAETGQKVEPEFKTEVRDASGELIAEVDKLLYVKKKKRDAGTSP